MRKFMALLAVVGLFGFGVVGCGKKKTEDKAPAGKTKDAADKPAEGAADKPAEGAADKPAEGAADKPAEGSGGE